MLLSMKTSPTRVSRWTYGTSERMLSRYVIEQRQSYAELGLSVAQAGVNGLLDVARTSYKEANNDVFELATQLGGSALIQKSIQLTKSS